MGGGLSTSRGQCELERTLLPCRKFPHPHEPTASLTSTLIVTLKHTLPTGAFGQPNYGERCIPSRPAPAAITAILANKEAIALNQAWAGHAGDFVPDLNLAPGVQVRDSSEPGALMFCCRFGGYSICLPLLYPCHMS